jgi:hypothetical protein
MARIGSLYIWCWILHFFAKVRIVSSVPESNFNNTMILLDIILANLKSIDYSNKIWWNDFNEKAGQETRIDYFMDVYANMEPNTSMLYL